jgi:peptidoglycan-N-acetylglucosamine deacetylase
MYYFIKTPWLLKKAYSNCTWSIPAYDKVMYLTFDDGPHPVATPVALDLLKQYNAKATFFCVGKNVEDYPDIYNRILEEGHRTGNHTFNHENGWKVSNEEYINSILKAEKYIHSNLFRPPYGRISKFQIKVLTTPSKNRPNPFRIIMWDVISADFDTALSPEQCTQNVLKHAKKGSVVIFHDSEKALPRMQLSLMHTLDRFSKEGYRFEVIQ